VNMAIVIWLLQRSRRSARCASVEMMEHGSTQSRLMGWPGRAQRPTRPLIGLGGIKAQGACDAHPSEVVRCGRHDRHRHR
jgi:hypothetical protein